MLKRYLLVAWCASLGSLPASAQDLSKHFSGITGTFVVLDAATGKYVRHDPQRAAQRFAPCSAFKIPHTAILLETGVAPDPEFTVKYDESLKQEGAWARDHTLRSAYRVSALWYFQVLAQRVGLAKEQALVDQLEYGNRSTAGGIAMGKPPFWVDGSLRISADEQVAFLKRFYEGRLGLSEKTTSLTKDIMIAESTSRWRLSAKTGACRPPGEDVTMWYVGYVEKLGNVHYFALQLGAKEFGALFEQRVTKAKAILTDLGVLD